MKVIELPLEWRCVAQALYRNGSSKVLIAGRKGARIFLTRSIRQGCPLSPFLFLFITEAMSAFFNSQGENLHGLSIPNSRKSLLDSEFADDTMLYLQGNEVNLERAQSAIDLFCKASEHPLIGISPRVSGSARSLTRSNGSQKGKPLGIWERGLG